MSLYVLPSVLDDQGQIVNSRSSRRHAAHCCHDNTNAKRADQAG